MRFVLYSLQALCITTAWHYASGLPHYAASICLVMIAIGWQYVYLRI